jgi:hypothetical protein
MATTNQINSFTATIMYEVVNIGNIISNLLSINGRTDNAYNELRFKLINIYADIITDFFIQSPYNVNNFMTTDQLQTVIDHFNNLCNTNYSIAL